MTVKEFCQTNGDYLLCLDAYRDYFKKEPPSEDKVKLIRFLAEYGADSTLQAMDIMARSRADSLNYCEAYCAAGSGSLTGLLSEDLPPILTAIYAA